MQGAHTFAACVEGEFPQPWHLHGFCLQIDTRFVCRHTQGCLGWIT
jgi:hypothetical protein